MINFNLKEFREKKGITQRQMTKILGVGETTIRKYDNKSDELTLKQISTIAIATKTTEEKLLGFKNYDINNTELADYCKMFNLSKNSVKKLIAIGRNNDLAKFLDLFLNEIKSDDLDTLAKEFSLPNLSNEFIGGEVITYMSHYTNKYLYPRSLSINNIIKILKNIIENIINSKEFAQYCYGNFHNFKLKEELKIKEMKANFKTTGYKFSFSKYDLPGYIIKQIDDGELLKKRKQAIENWKQNKTANSN